MSPETPTPALSPGRVEALADHASATIRDWTRANHRARESYRAQPIAAHMGGTPARIRPCCCFTCRKLLAVDA